MVLEKIRRIFAVDNEENISTGEEYVEIDIPDEEKPEKKVVVKLFVLKEYEDANEVVNALREEYTIAVIDIKNLRQKDPIELKRAISKIKKTVDARGGSIAGFGENTVIATPRFAEISKQVYQKQKKENEFDTENL